MNVLEIVIAAVFIVPLAAACLFFVICASWMQMKEDQSSAEKRGLAQSL